MRPNRQKVLPEVPVGVPDAQTPSELEAALVTLTKERVGAVMKQPTRSGIALTAGGFGVALPLATGVVDLWLRSVTP